ncbi:hypothetical protein D3C71_1968480 [compost metagenome]
MFFEPVVRRLWRMAVEVFASFCMVKPSEVYGMYLKGTATKSAAAMLALMAYASDTEEESLKLLTVGIAITSLD